MNDIKCFNWACSIGKIRYKTMEKEERLQMAYNEAFKNTAGLKDQSKKPYAHSSNITMLIKFDASIRNDLVAYLLSKGITVGSTIYQNHLYKMYKPYYRKLPVTESVWEKIVVLPVFPDLTKTQLNYIIKTVKNFRQ